MMSQIQTTVTYDQADHITRETLQEELGNIQKHLQERQRDACAGSNGERGVGVFHSDPEQDVIELTNLADSLKKVLDWYS